MWNSHLGEDNIALSLLLSIAFLILVVLLWRVGLRAIRKHVISDFANGIRWQ
jgi:F0F1-type ATP synthase membrane subunit b/b'